MTPSVSHSRLRPLLLASMWGMFFGLAGGVLLHTVSGLTPRVKTSLPLLTAIEIWTKNMLLATLICHGGAAWALAELQLYRFGRLYHVLELTAAPLHRTLVKIWPECRQLSSVWRSCYLSLFAFPTGCMFFLLTLITLYFSFFALRGVEMAALARLTPHVILEVLAMGIAAYLALGTAEGLRKNLLTQQVDQFVAEIKESWRDRGVWSALLLTYAILLVAAAIEKALIEM